MTQNNLSSKVGKDSISPWNHIHISDMKQRKDWGILLLLANDLDQAAISFHIDGKAMIFIHGLEFPLDKICVTFKWNEEERVREFFGSSSETKSNEDTTFKYFDTAYQNYKIRCMFFDRCIDDVTDEILQRNAEPIDVDGQIIMAQTLEFYLEYEIEKDALYNRVNDFVSAR